ncbi:MAG: putative nucleoside-diphosphate sugar epimerase [Ferruginibacter sp.]|uniref:polysaccharide biosynthesis protein n=1 Tax=Ferruginibacter sp. TaxID=1940288 RepID=UPI002658EAF1|nr:nucleoside-diphosphate sugar epimerase/dehydratase [Ferruginibacter sp.]MDB5275519.1 putative nucleoside-diphosphate sugar epimerase [Ferruginibacter sp.]
MSSFFLKNFAPRWIIFCCDIILITVSFTCSFFLIEHLSIDVHDLLSLLPALITNLVVGIFCIGVFAIYKGIIRYSEAKDIVRIIKFAFLQFAIWVLLFLVDTNHLVSGVVTFPLLVINLFAVIFVLVAFRLLVKEVYFMAQARPNPANRTLIFGAGMMGQITQKVLQQDAKINTTLVGFIDDSQYKIGKKLEGLPIYNAADAAQLGKLFKSKRITHLYIAIDKLSVDRKIALTDLCAPYKIRVNVVPHAKQWSGGLFQKNQVKEMNIEDLLERDEIILPNDQSKSDYTNATILVTGAAGSIGSEICRQLVGYDVKKLIILDQAESGLFDLEYELRQKGMRQGIQVEVASVRDYMRIKKLFVAHQPDFVFHVAAYKHVPLMECFSSEAVLTNIFGTKVIADLSMLHSVKKFVLVSTDKAVNPTNVMGATKRVSEIYIQSLNDRIESNTEFITTRFGNVLGSAGSVVATFKKQIAEGGPVTITHPEITRYFMTIPEAAKLVLEAGRIGKSSDILLFDMGKPVKIMDLATRMIQLAGFVPGKEIAIQCTSLRPGEKMYEELFKDSEEFAPTSHPKILRAKKCSDTNPNFYSLLIKLEAAAIAHSNEMIAPLLGKMLPEFKHAPNKIVKKPLTLEKIDKLPFSKS